MSFFASTFVEPPKHPLLPKGGHAVRAMSAIPCLLLHLGCLLALTIAPPLASAQDWHVDQVAGRYRIATMTFQRASSANGAEQTRLYERAASLFVRDVDGSPGEQWNAPVALEQAGIALQRAHRFGSAARLYQRIVDDFGAVHGASSGEKGHFDNIISNAYVQLAFSASRSFDYDRALANYRVVADSPRWTTNRTELVVLRRERALVGMANLLELQERYADAAIQWRRVVDTSRYPVPRLNAAYRAALMSFKQRRWTETVQEMRAFMRRYRSNPYAGELTVLAAWSIVEARRGQNDTQGIRRALHAVIGAFARSREPPGSIAAERAAQAQFELIDSEGPAFAIVAGRPATLTAYVAQITEQIRAKTSLSRRLAARYEPIRAYDSPAWTTAALVQQGRIYEALARAVSKSPLVIPSDVQRQMRALAPEDQDTLRAAVERRVQQVLDESVRPLDCLAVERYALAARAARAASIDDQHARLAHDRLNAYGDDQVLECVIQAHAADASFAPASPNEFARAPRGQHLEVPPGIAPPSLAPEDP